MKMQLTKKWIDNLDKLDIAFQPILNIQNGDIFAVEALLRNNQEIGFASIFSVFDEAYKENLLYSFDIELRKKAFEKFTHIKNFSKIKLFYNLDNRLLEMPNFTNGNTNKLLEDIGISRDNICFEISERHEITSNCNMQELLKHYNDEDFCIAIDDFGVGYSGYKLLYDTKPNIIKIDRFFLTGIEKDAKKKVMVRNITHLAIQLGIKVVAEGVQSKAELLTCRDIGCHLVQGYLIQRPTLNTEDILDNYPHIQELIKNDKRISNSNSNIDIYIDKTESLTIDSKMTLVIDYFKKYSQSTLLPIVDSNNRPIGILQEEKIKEFLYSAYGKSLLLNDTTKNSKLKNLIQACGIADIHTDISTIIELFSNNPDSPGIIITNNNKYYGFLSARAIISIMNEQNLLYAKEQNPLTKLPGNTMIEKYINTVSSSNDSYILCYFDLDNFKAFNDAYGFRNGDRVIQLFADIMRKNLHNDIFKGHIGGDDFFCGIKINDNDDMPYKDKICEIINKFIDDVKDVYSKSDKDRGYILAKDRDDVEKRFPLLTVSASILVINQRAQYRCIDSMNKILSMQKKIAKNDLSHISISSML
ncbi:GGDEF domain-containing protein [Sulfurimonas sp.]|nr:GGDEF domain-containing protein [Sulfurimonas sp.]